MNQHPLVPHQTLVPTREFTVPLNHPSSISEVAERIRAGEIDVIHVEPGLDLGAFFRPLPPAFENEVVDRKCASPFPLLCRSGSDPLLADHVRDCWGTGVFLDSSWCYFVNKDSFDPATLSCRKTSLVQRFMRRALPSWILNTIWSNKVGASQETDIGLMLEILTTKNEKLADKWYPIPGILWGHMPEQTGFPHDDDVPNMSSLPRGADRNVRFSQAFHPCVAPFVKNSFKYPPGEVISDSFNNEGIAHFAKLLVSASCIDHLSILWNVNLSDAQPIRLPTGSIITTSPPGCHFPGTEDRVVCIRADTFQEISARARDILGACMLAAAPEINGKLGIRIAVPRRVVGTVIGRGGSHIQTLRHITQATIHISPLFVTSEFACSERVISVSSKDPVALENAIITLLSLINKHPERASCQRTYYKNGLNSDNNPQHGRQEAAPGLTAKDAAELFQMFAV